MSQSAAALAAKKGSLKKETLGKRIVRDFLMNKFLYVMLLPVIAYYAVFHYGPMYGALIAFKDYSPVRGVLGSEWVGFVHFTEFFNSYYFWRVLKNTVIISVLSLLFVFPAPILLALALNEIRSAWFRGFTQSVSYMPYFISMIVICGMIVQFTNNGGIINNFATLFGYDGLTMLQRAELFRPIYIASEIWQKVGWDSIIYIAALSGIDQEQYEAARIDGASRLKQMFHITLPGIMPTIAIMFILRMGNMLDVGFEKIILLYNPMTYETADVISSFVYRKGLLEFNWSYSSAVGLMNSGVNLMLLILANYVVRKLNENNSLW